MTTTAALPVRTATLEVPGARLHYELRGKGPLLVLIGAPMDANAFRPLAELLAADHTVLTTDPRGINHSWIQDPTADSTPELRAEDLSQLIAHLDAGPATVFGSSGGAVTALALMQAHLEQVDTVIAHEPPLDELLPDCEQLRADTDDLCATYLAGDIVGAWRKFFAAANIALSREVLQQLFGGERDLQVIADERFWFAHEMRPSTRWRPDLALLRSAASQVVVGIGQDSAGQACDRTSRALTSALHTQPVMFPGGHLGFVDDPAVFAPRLLAQLPDAA